MRLENVYTDDFFSRREAGLSWRAPIVCSAINKVYTPLSVIDVGCAIGDLVKGFLDLGIDAYGLEGAKTVLPYLMFPKERLILHDLRIPVNEVSRRYELVLCLEVAEHIEEVFVEVFLDTLVKFADKQILMSAAIPGQEGHSHFNCQPYTYWIDKMGERGFLHKQTRADGVRSEWLSHAHLKGIRAFHYNIMSFEKIEGCDE